VIHPKADFFADAKMRIARSHDEFRMRAERTRC